jgi:replication initiation and membrane attachment protein
VPDSINKKPEDDADGQQLVQQFDQPTQQVIQISKENAPISFLKQIKDQKGGMVTAGEQRMIRELVSKGLLPREVINVLIYYVLIGIGNSTLNQNLVNTIADNWAQNHVTNAEKAILQVQKRTEEKQEKETQRSQRRYSSGGRRQITETLPDWAKKEKQQTKEASKKAKQSAEQQETGPDEAERKRVNKELAELRKRKEKRGEN